MVDKTKIPIIIKNIQVNLRNQIFHCILVMFVEGCRVTINIKRLGRMRTLQTLLNFLFRNDFNKRAFILSNTHLCIS